LKNKKIIIRKIVAFRDIKKGELINEKNTAFKRATHGVDVKYYNFIEGKKAKKDINKDDMITFNTIEVEV
jgi:sialic acid synthase SpsE